MCALVLTSGLFYLQFFIFFFWVIVKCIVIHQNHGYISLLFSLSFLLRSLFFGYQMHSILCVLGSLHVTSLLLISIQNLNNPPIFDYFPLDSFHLLIKI